MDTLHPAVDRELKMAAMRAHNIGFYKPSLWHMWCQVLYFSWCSSGLLDVHLELSIITLKTEKSLRSCNSVQWLHDNSRGRVKLNRSPTLYHLRACHPACWCGCWLHSSGSPSPHFGSSHQGWQVDELGESGQWGNYGGPAGTCDHRWSVFLQREGKVWMSEWADSNKCCSTLIGWLQPEV